MGVRAVRLLRSLSLAIVLGAWAVIVIGGYVSHTESGLGCGTEPILCSPSSGPQAAEAALIEAVHRVTAWVEGILVLGLLVLVWRRYSTWRIVRDLTTLGFELVVLQAVLGMVAVVTELNPMVVTGHLGVASGFLAVTVLNAAIVFRNAPPTPQANPAPAQGAASDSA